MVGVDAIFRDPQGRQRLLLRFKILLVGRAAGIADEGPGHAAERTDRDLLAQFFPYQSFETTLPGIFLKRKGPTPASAEGSSCGRLRQVVPG